MSADPVTDFDMRERARGYSRRRRARLKADGVCINGREHGKATHGVLCARCRRVHNFRGRVASIRGETLHDRLHRQAVEHVEQLPNMRFYRHSEYGGEFHAMRRKYDNAVSNEYVRLLQAHGVHVEIGLATPESVRAARRVRP